MACHPHLDNEKTFLPRVDERPLFVRRTLYKSETQKRSERLASRKMCFETFMGLTLQFCRSLSSGVVDECVPSPRAGVQLRLKRLFSVWFGYDCCVCNFVGGSEIRCVPVSVFA